MRRPLLLLALAAAIGCSRELIEPDVPVSIALDSLPFPAVAVGDTLRDTSGVVQPVRAQAFNFRGEPLEDVAFRYFILDRGARIDSITGIAVGDSVRATPVRIVAALGDLQTQPRPLLSVVPRPDSLAPVLAVDTLRYSLTDTVNFSRLLTVRLLHQENGTTPVPSWLVSYEIVSPEDTLLATIFAEGSQRSHVDTTAADGLAGRRIFVRPQHLTATSDSVVLLATARYRGAHVSGSPVRLVVHLRPPGE